MKILHKLSFHRFQTSACQHLISHAWLGIGSLSVFSVTDCCVSLQFTRYLSLTQEDFNSLLHRHWTAAAGWLAVPVISITKNGLSQKPCVSSALHASTLAHPCPPRGQIRRQRSRPKEFFRLAAIAHRDWDGAFACAAPVHSTPGDQVLGFPRLSSDHW